MRSADLAYYFCQGNAYDGDVALVLLGDGDIRRQCREVVFSCAQLSERMPTPDRGAVMEAGIGAALVLVAVVVLGVIGLGFLKAVFIVFAVAAGEKVRLGRVLLWTAFILLLGLMMIVGSLLGH